MGPLAKSSRQEEYGRFVECTPWDQGTPELHWNLEEKTTEENIHVVIK